MKTSAYIAVILPFLLLAMLLAAVLNLPRQRSTSVGAVHAAVTLPVTVVTATRNPPATVSPSALAGTAATDSAAMLPVAAEKGWSLLRAARRPAALLRMPYFSFARDIDLSGGR